MTRDELFRTLKRAVAGSFEVLAELGRGQGDRNAYVAKDVAGGGLVVLELNLEDRDPDGTPNYGLYIRRELDATIPSLSLQCDQCGAAISGWARYCPNCDRDLSGVAHTTGGRSAAELLQRGSLGGQERYEFLGEMPRTEGGGAVYFARERASGRLVALRVEKDAAGGGADYRLTTTQTMAALPSSEAVPTPPQQPRVAWRGAGEPTTSSSTAAAPPAPSAPAKPTDSGWFCPTCGTTYEAGVWFCPRDGTAVKPAVVTDRLIGQTVAGRFHVVRKLGSGGMGTVYLAEHVRIGRRCALKIMNPSLKDEPEALGRFAREAAHASRITHPNVAAIYDFGEAEDGTIYLAMEYADGESLSTLMKRAGALAPARACDLVGQVLDALAAAHALGIVHRDLKPDNIILASTPTGKQVVKVVDFGIAKAMQSTDSQQLTRTGFVVGTPRYMSPEQITGGLIDGRTDLYSAACILYELLVGSAPFTGPSGEITITRRLSEPPPHPRRANRSIAKRLDQVVVRAMARAADDRYHTAEEFRTVLAEAARPDLTGDWAARLAGATLGLAKGGQRVRELGARAAHRAGRGLGAFGRGAAGASVAGGRALQRLARPLLSWKYAAALALLALLGAGAPAVVRWLGSSASDAAAPESQSPPGASGAATDVTDDVVAGAPEAQSALPGYDRDTVAAPPAAGVTASGSPPPPSNVAPSSLKPVVVPASELDGLRRKLELVAMLSGEESFTEAFEQLRQVRSRLDALGPSYPGAQSLRQVRAEYTSTLTATTSNCERVRRVALQLGETPPACR